MTLTTLMHATVILAGALACIGCSDQTPDEAEPGPSQPPVQERMLMTWASTRATAQRFDLRFTVVTQADTRLRLTVTHADGVALSRSAHAVAGTPLHEYLMLMHAGTLAPDPDGGGLGGITLTLVLNPGAAASTLEGAVLDERLRYVHDFAWDVADPAGAMASYAN